MRLRSALVPLLVGAAMVGACGPSGGGGGNDDGDDDGDDDGTPDAGGDDNSRPDARVRPDAGPPTDPPPAQACTKMDILFVVDNSNSMDREQQSLGANFPEFARVLDEYRVESGEPLDYRVALTTTAREIYTFHTNILGRRVDDGLLVEGENGTFRDPPAISRKWIESSDASRQAALTRVADVGIGGSHLEMPLDAARLALSVQAGSGKPNAGFVREDALLAVVYLTDEEDCSRLDALTQAEAAEYDPFWDTDEVAICTRGIAQPQAYVDFFDQLKGDRKRWATAVIAGDGQGRASCTSTFGDAEDAPRLKQFVQLTGENAIFRSICDGDLAPALKDALDTFQAACEGLPPVD
jgi:hypothetical protein